MRNFAFLVLDRTNNSHVNLHNIIFIKFKFFHSFYFNKYFWIFIKYININFSSFTAAEQLFEESLKRVHSIKDSILPYKWEPLLNNIGHNCRKLGKYDESIYFHQEVNNNILNYVSYFQLIWFVIYKFF